MLKSLRLQNFKAFEDQTIELRPLTLLTGINGMGKSSVLQALLLLRQSFLQGQLELATSLYRDLGMLGETIESGLVLNGDLVSVGTGRDILFEGAKVDEIGISLELENIADLDVVARYGNIFEKDLEEFIPIRVDCQWSFSYDRNTDVLKLSNFGENVPSTAIHSEGHNGDFIATFRENLFSEAGRFHYLQAERVGPRTSLPTSDYKVRELHQIGAKGEYAVQYLQVYGSRKVEISTLYHSTQQMNPENPPTLLETVTAWLREVSPGVRLNIQPYNDVDLIRVAFAFERARDVTNNYRATNVGFGLSYTLPVLVAVLSSTPGSLILLENPEAHLHPRGQSQLGALLARAAAGGVQIICETHSDHVLNGIRLAVRDGILEPDKVAIHFFQRPEDDDASAGVEVVTPELDSDGRIDYWPDNFFDEYGKALRKLL